MNYYQAKAEENLNINIYESCIVFNKQSCWVLELKGYERANVSYDYETKMMKIKFGNEGCKINYKSKRLNMKKIISELGLPLGKFRVKSFEDDEFTIDTSTRVRLYENAGQGMEGGKLNTYREKDDEWYERNTPDMYGVPNH